MRIVTGWSTSVVRAIYPLLLGFFSSLTVFPYHPPLPFPLPSSRVTSQSYTPFPWHRSHTLARAHTHTSTHIYARHLPIFTQDRISSCRHHQLHSTSVPGVDSLPPIYPLHILIFSHYPSAQARMIPLLHSRSTRFLLLFSPIFPIMFRARDYRGVTQHFRSGRFRPQQSDWGSLTSVRVWVPSAFALYVGFAVAFGVDLSVRLSPLIGASIYLPSLFDVPQPSSLGFAK